jgi:hypothetical protein
VKNQWIKAKFKRNLYLGIAQQCIKFQMNICKQSEKKYGKLIISNFFLSSRAITSWKINGSEPNSYLICIYVRQSHVPNIKWIWGKKYVKQKIRDFFSKSKGHNFVKNQWINTKLKLDLYLGMAKQCTKYQRNICKQREKKSGKL